MKVLFETLLTDIHLVSINRKMPGHPKYKINFEHITALLAMARKSVPTLTQPLSAFVVINAKLDIDNAFKLIYDTLQKSGVIENDKQIVHGEHYVVRRILDKGYHRLYIRLSPAPPENIFNKFLDK